MKKRLMMKHTIDGFLMQEILSKIDRFYPEFMKPKDLVELGLWGTRSSLSLDMKKEGYTPKFIRLGPKKIRFAKEDVIKFIIGKE
jgi:hypothetical protein